MRLVPASLDPPEGLEAFLIEVGEGESGFGPAGYTPEKETLSSFLQRQADNAESRNLPEGWVPQTTFWLLDDAGAIVGMCRLRHKLTDGLLHHGGHIGYYVRESARRKGYGAIQLSLALAEGRKLGIERFLLTVDDENVASIRVIEGNGGVLEDKRIDVDTGRLFRRYWIG
jgi:predicted acetyltransferase